MYILAAILTSNLAEDNVWEKTNPLPYAHPERWNEIQTAGVPVNRRWRSVPGATPHPQQL